MPAPPPLVLAPPEKLRLLAELRARLREQEAESLRGADVFGLLGYVPTPKQQEFHDAAEFDVLFGGAAGGGKSRALTAEAIRACIQHPGIRVGAFRRTYPELKESLIAELAAMEFASALGARWNGSDYELRFTNGSLLMFRYAETVVDATRRQGGQYQMLIFDERTLTPPDVISFLESRLRSGRADIPVLGVRSSANPGGAGHGAVKARYIVPTNYGEHVVTDDRNRLVRFIPSKLADNPHVNPEYAADLAALPEKLRAAFLHGDWDVFAGAMFRMDRSLHVVEPFTLPAQWKRYAGVDWGFANPWAVVWGAVDEDGRVWLYREIREAGVGEAEQARRILEAEQGDGLITARFADDAMWAVRGDARPISTIYSAEHCRLVPAGKGSRVTGWQRVRSYLANGPACPHHRALGYDACPMLHMFTTLAETYRTLSDLPHATKGDPEDADSAGDDHLADALRYLLINLGGGAEAWIEWAKRKALEAAAARRGVSPPPRTPAVTAPAPEPEPAAPDPVPDPDEDPRAALIRARNAAFRAGSANWR